MSVIVEIAASTLLERAQLGTGSRIPGARVVGDRQHPGEPEVTSTKRNPQTSSEQSNRRWEESSRNDGE